MRGDGKGVGDYLISRNAVIEELTFRIGVCDEAIHREMSLPADYSKAGQVAMNYAYARLAYMSVLRAVKSVPVKGVCERGDSDAQH